MALEQFDQLLSVHKSLSASLASFELQARELNHGAPSLEPVIVGLQAQKAAVEQQKIAQLTVIYQEFSIAAKLEKVPDVGKVARLSARRAPETAVGHKLITVTKDMTR